MSKYLLTTLCLLCMTSLSKAQTNLNKKEDNKITFGLRTGYEFQVNNSNLNYSLKLPYFGASADYKLNKYWSLGIELNLRYEDRERRFNNGGIESVNEFYFTVPVLLKYKLNNDFNIYSGSQILSASLVSDVLGLKKWNGIIGLEYSFTKNLYFDARLRHGFESRTSLNNFRDNRLSVGLSYKF